MSADPIISYRAPRDSDAYQAGFDYISKPASEIADDEVDLLDASERAFYLAWVDKHMNDHEAALHNAEPAEDEGKWCPVPGKQYGYHGYYTGHECSECADSAAE